jgi:N-acetylmuramoyl-L-alanine amidase
MARPRAGNLLYFLAGLLLSGGCSAPATGQGRSTAPAVAPVSALPPPPRAVPVLPPPAAPVTRLWPVKRLYDVDYVEVQAIADRFGLKASWLVSGRVLQLTDAGGRVVLRFENRDRSFYFDGIRVFMAEPTVLSQGNFCVSRIDVIKTIVPLVHPAEYADRLPGPPRLIVLDAGHGGADPGTRNLVMHLDEKNITLDVVQRLKKLLEGRGYRVILTRSDDTKLAPAQRTDLEERDAVANRTKADLFLSVHFNSAVASVTGTETYVMTPQSELSTGEARDATVDKAFPANRLDFANIVLGYHLHRNLVNGLNSQDRGCKRGRRLVLCFPECPAALVEAAYLSNNADASRLATPEFRQKVAQSLADGIDEYSAALAALHPSASGPSEPRPAPAASQPHP